MRKEFETDVETIRNVEIVWADGRTQTFTGVKKQLVNAVGGGCPVWFEFVDAKNHSIGIVVLEPGMLIKQTDHIDMLIPSDLDRKAILQ